MHSKEIQAFVYDTEQEVTDKIALINAAQGYPNAGADTYCSYEFNNEKWIIKLSPDIGMETMFLPDVAEDFEYQEDYPYYIKFNSEDNILKIYTYSLYPKPFRVLNINSLSESEQVIMDNLRSLVSSDYLGFTMIEFIREDSLIKIHTLSEGIVPLPMADMSASDVIAYEAVGTICNELVETL